MAIVGSSAQIGTRRCWRKKNPRNSTEKMEFKKYDPVVRKHVVFREAKIK